MSSACADPREQAYWEYHDKVSAYVRGKINNYHEAEDLVSNIFLKVYQKWDSFDPSRASISTWIYAITRNAMIDYYRAQRETVEYADYMESVADAFSDEENDEEELLDHLADALMTLKPKERDLIVLHYYKGYTLKKISELMDMSYINAKVVHKMALSRLRETMGS